VSFSNIISSSVISRPHRGQVKLGKYIHTQSHTHMRGNPSIYL
jgi:hypothetical protein